MQTEISKSQFKAHALELFRQVEASGQPLIITDHGHPTLEVRKLEDRVRVPRDVLRGSVLRFDLPTAPVAVDDWEAAR